MAEVDNQTIDNLQLRIQKLIEDGAVFKVDSLAGPRQIIVTQGNKLTAVESAAMPFIPVGIISYKELKASPFSVSPDGKLSPILQPIEKDIDQFSTKLLPKGTNITVQLVPDSYFTQDELLKRTTKAKGIFCVIYIPGRGNDTYQNVMVRNGMAFYDNREYGNIKDLFQVKGRIDRLLVEDLEDSQTLAISEKKGFWSNNYAASQNIAKVIEQLRIKTKQLPAPQLAEEIDKIKKFEADRLKPGFSAQDRLIQRKKQIAEEKASYTRRYSESSLGDQLSQKAKRYFPGATGEDIIKQIVAGILPKSAMQIGALWCGIPTYDEEKAGLGAASHPVEIVEVRKDGDVRPILGQGFMSMVMGDRPPDEGLTFVLSVNSRGIETFIAPLVTQFRMDPIVPIRNLHLARFARPIFSNKEFYSKIFGKLPDNLGKLVNRDGTYFVENQEDVRELSRALDLMYLIAPVYVAIKQIEVQNLNNNDGAFTVKISCGIADVTENFGFMPEYFKTIEDAFEIHQKRVKVVDRMRTEKAIRYIAKQVGAGAEIVTYKLNPDDLTPEDSYKVIAEYRDSVRAKQKDLKTSSFIVRESKLVEIPSLVSAQDAAAQVKGTASTSPDKIGFGKMIVYKPSLGTRSNYNLLKTFIGCVDIRPGSQDIKELISHFDLAPLSKSQIPIPVGPSTRYRNARVTKQDVSSSAFMSIAQKVERTSLIDPKLVDGNPVSGLFAIRNSGMKAYKFGYNNWRDNSVIGLGDKNVLQPFELVAVRNIEPGSKSTITNMDVEYACALGMPVVSVEKKGTNYELQLLGVDTKNIADETNGTVIVDRKPITFYEGNIRSINRTVGIIDLPDNDKYQQALQNIVANQDSTSSPKFAPETTATFNYAYTRPDKKSAKSTVQGTYGTLKFHNSQYRSLVTTSSKSARDQISVKLEPTAQAVTDFARDTVSQSIDFWPNVIRNVILGESQKSPLQFTVEYRSENKKQKATIAFTDMLTSELGINLYFFVNTKTKQPVVFRSSKYDDQMLSLIGSYIRDLKSIATKPKEDAANVKPPIKAGLGVAPFAPEKVSIASAKTLKDKLVKIRNLVQSILNKQKTDLLEANDIPDGLTNLTQILASAKGFRGTHFLDESEPYFFSLMYQLNLIQATKYDMTFKVRPDRVPYKDPGFIDENYLSMQMKIYREEPPKELDRNDAYTEQLRLNEEFISRVNSPESLSSYITEKAIEYIKTITGTESSTGIDALLQNPIYVVAAMQTVMLQYFDLLFSAHMLAKGAGVLVSKGVKIDLPEDVSRKQQGLPDRDVEAKFKEQSIFYKRKIEQIQLEVASKLKKVPTSPQAVPGDVQAQGPETFENLIKKTTNINQLSADIVGQLGKIVDSVYDRIYDSKTPNGQHFVSLENVKRILAFGGLDHPNQLTNNTTRLLDSLLSLFKQTVDILVSKKQSQNLFTLKKGQVEVKGGIIDGMRSLNDSMQDLLAKVRAIRLATGNSIDFIKKKTLKLRKPIPQIGIIEEYGVSDPIRAPGRKKPTYQVIGGTSTQAYIQLHTNISEMYINENSKIQDLIEEEEGIDAIYNVLREPSEITTVYNMLRSGRAMVRDAATFNAGSNILFKTNATQDSLQNAFRLVKRSSINSANVDAYGTLLGMTQPHVEIIEPFFLAMGLSKFVAKTTRISSGGDTTSWKLDMYLLPYEAGYTTNRNLKKVNRSLTNQQFGDINAFLGAAYNPAIPPETLKAPGIVADDISAQAAKKLASQVGDLRAYENKLISSRFAIAAAFSNLVALHAIYKAKQKIFAGIMDKSFSHPADSFSLKADSFNESTLKAFVARRKSLVTELDLKSSDFAITSNFGELGLAGQIPVSVSVKKIGDLFSVGGSLTGAAGEYLIKKFKSPLVRLVGGRSWIVRAAGATASFVTTASGIASALLDARASNVQINAQSADIVQANIRNNISSYVLLSQNFSIHAIEFLQDYLAEEAAAPGSGAQFLELIAREAQSVVSNAGSLTGIAYFNNSVEGEDIKTNTICGAFVSTYPVDSLIQKGTQETFFTLNGQKIENISIVVINSSISGNSDALAGNLAFETIQKDFYHYKKDDKKKIGSFFGDYFTAFAESKGKNRRTQIDVCGEELLQLIIDAQSAIYNTDIYSVALNPKFVAAEPGLYNAVMQGVVGRLKLNHFGEYLLGVETLTLHANKILTLFDGDASVKNRYLNYLGIQSKNGVLKKVLNSNQIRDVYSSYNREEIRKNLSLIAEAFPLGNGRVIFNKLADLYSFGYDIPENQSYLKENIYQYDSALRAVNGLARQIYSQAPATKRSALPIPTLFNAVRYFGLDLTVTDFNEVPDSPDTYTIPGTDSSQTDKQNIAKLKDSTGKFTKDQIAFFWAEYRKCLLNHLVWLIDSYSTTLDGVTQSEMMKADPAFGFRTAVQTQLAINLAADRGISLEDANMQILASSQQDLKEFLTSRNANFDTKDYQDVQKACDQIALYSNGNALGKQSLYQEYIVFLDTFKEVFLQIGFAPNPNQGGPKYIKGFENNPTYAGTTSFSYLGRTTADLWSNLDSTNIKYSQGVVGLKTNDLEVKVNLYRGVTGFGRYQPGVYFTMSDVRTDSESYSSISKVHNFMKTFYGIERPEYIPAVLGVFTIGDDKQLSFRRTDICLDMLSLYSMRFNQDAGDYFKKAASIYLAGGAPPLSGRALLSALEVAGSFGLMVGTKNPLAGLIVAVVVFIAVIAVQFFFLTETPSLAGFNQSFMAKLTARITTTKISTTPLFTAMKALLVLADNFNETDLVVLPLIGTRDQGTGPRSISYVYPPDLDQAMDANEYIIQDTLSYLTLPLITKKQVSTVADVLSPGGNVIPDVKKLNENQQALASVLLVQEGFFKDHLEKLPEFIEIEKTKALAINAPGINTNPLEPQQGTLEHDWFQGTLRFITNMEGIYIGDASAKNIGNQLGTYLNFDVDGKNNFIIRTSEQLLYIYKRLAVEVLPGFGADYPADIYKRKFFSGIAAINPQARQIMQESAVLAADILWPRDIVSIKSAKEAAEKKGVTLVDRKPESFLAENAFYLSVTRPNGKDDPKEYGLFANRALFISALFDTTIGITSQNLEKAGVSDAKNLIDDNKNYLLGDYAIWGDASVGDNVEANMYFRYNGGKIIEIRANKRGQSFSEGWFEKSDTFIMREVSSEGRQISRANNSKEDEGFLVTGIAVPHLFNANNVFLARRSTISRNVMLSERFFYIFNRKIDQNKVNKAKADGYTWILAATKLRQQYASIADRPYMVIPAKPTGRTPLTFVEAYAAKLSLDQSFPTGDLTVNWSHIFQAIEDIGDYFAYTAYAADFKNKAGGTTESSLYINKSDKVYEAPKGTSIGAFKQNNAISADTIAGVFAATSGLTSQYVMDKLEQYMDQQSSLQWDALGKASKEVRNTINAPMRMYPCAKLYFIRKERGGSILYDDLYSYADILSVKVFESAKSPGNVLVVQLANNENKLENIIAAKDNARNPFEVKSRSQDQLSGLMLKAGTRIMVTLGYGNLITEENKFVGEIEQATPNPDGTYTITARGPGWVLNNPFSADAGVQPNPKDASTPGKTLSINGSAILTGQMPATETDKNKVMLSNLANPQNAIARSLLLYGLLRLGNVSRYGRLGSTLSEIAEDTAFALPEVNDEYTSLVQDGLIQNGFTLSNFIANAKDYISKIFIGDLAGDVVELYKNQSPGNEVFKVNTFSKNILLSESFPAVDGLGASISQWFINKYTQLQGNTVPEWKITNETYWEFIKEVLLTVPNAKSYVRTYETDGSLIIGGADEYYTMYKTKSYIARMASSVFTNLATLKETNNVLDILKRFNAVVGSMSSKPEQEGIEMIAEVLTGVISTLAFNQVDRAVVSSLLKKVSDATFPLPVIENQSASNISELFNQLKNTTTQTYLLTELLQLMIGSTLPDTKSDILDSLYKNLIGAFVPGGQTTVSAIDLYFKTTNAIASKDAVAALGDPRTILNSPVAIRYKLLRDLFNTFLTNLNNAPDSTKKLLEMAMQLSFSSKIDPSTITAIKDQVDVEGSSSAAAKRILFTFALCTCRAFSNKMHKLRTLSPDKRKVQESFYMFSGRDIVHNAASTMLGYNEGEFVFDEVSTSTGESSGAANLPVLGLLGSLFGSKITRFGFAVDPVSSESGGTGDYSAKRLIVNLNNPAYFSAFLSIGTIGNSDKKGPILTVLSIMATSQMQEMVKDWYGGEIVAFGDSEKRSNDVVFMYDYIRDMYGPFEIKEAVHSFDSFGFLSTYTPSVYTRSEPRNITDETDGAGATLVGNVILGAFGAVVAYKTRGVLGKIIGKIPGVARTLTKFNMSVAKGIGTLLDSQILSKNPLKMARGAFAFGAGKVGQGAMWLARRIVIDPIIKNSDYARVTARATAGRFIKTLEIPTKDISAAYAKANGFTDAKAMSNFLKERGNFIKESDVFKNARDFFAKNPSEKFFETADFVTGPNGITARLPKIKISRDEMNKIDNLLAKAFDENPGGVIHSLAHNAKLDAAKTAVFEDLRLAFSKSGLSTETLTRELITGAGPGEGYVRMKNFLHFLEGKRIGGTIPQDIKGVTNIANIQLAMRGADEATVASLTNLSLDELKAINLGKNYAKSPVVFSKAADNFAVNMSDDAVADMQIALASATTPETQARAVGRFVSEMERLATGSASKTAQTITINQTKVRVTAQDISNFRDLLGARNTTTAAMYDSIATKMTSIQKELADKTIAFKDLSPEAKAIINEAGETFTSAAQQQVKGLRADLNKLEQKIRVAESSTVEGRAAAEQFQAQKADLKRRISEIEGTAASLKKNMDSDMVREQAAKNIGDSLSKDAAKLKDATVSIGSENLNSIKGDKITARILSSTSEGKHQGAGYNAIANITKEGAATRFSRNPINSIGSIVKGLTSLFTIYQTYGLVRDTVGESITEYRLLLGKQAAANSLITEFMVYKGEPFLSNLEGITRNSSKLITGDTTYLDYLKSRFYSATEITDFLRSQYSSIVSSALTQYSDQLLSTTIDTGLYQSLDSGLSFNSAGGFGGDTFGSTLNKVDNLGNPENLVSPFHPNKFVVGTGFYDKGADGNQHNGTDIASGKFTKALTASEIAANNAVFAIESGFAVAESQYDFATLDKSRAAGYGIRDKSNNPTGSGAITPGGVRVIVFGLETGIVWWYSHTFPNLGSTGFDDTILQESKKVRPILSSERIGMCGPWGYTSGAHVHLEAYQIKVPEFDEARKIYTEGKTKGLTVKTNTALIDYFNKNYKKIRAKVTNSVRVPPEEIFNKTTLVSQWGNKKK